MVNKCDNNYTDICYIHYDFLVAIREHFFNFYRPTDKKCLGTIALVFGSSKKKFKLPSDYSLPTHAYCDLLLKSEFAFK